MAFPRISIKGLMNFVVLVGVGLAALARPNNGWAIVMPSLYVTMLLTSILGIILRRGPRRASWLGFALFGWAFFLVVVLAHPHDSIPIFDIYKNLMILIEVAVVAVSHDREDIVGILRFLGGDDNETVLPVMLSLIGLSFAWLGGRIARFLARNEPPTPPEPGTAV